VINDEMSVRKGRYGPYVYYKTNNMNKPKFIGLKNKSIEEVTREWVLENL
jgi:topoisomerase IA-like protein